MLYPFQFAPLFKERIWGGRNLADLFQKPLPPTGSFGESWEISDRPGDVSQIRNGPLAGKDLRWLMEHHGDEVLGTRMSANARFPLLVKILDARDTLSLQVHPPAARAAALGGEPKSELWYVAAAEPGAELYAGLRPGVTRSEFEKRIQEGTVADCFHRVQVKKGDTMFLPSGRVHALGKGLVIFEIQQNSDTTYRVFDWNRVGADGKPRDLHVAQSLQSIDFSDFEPGLEGKPPVSDATGSHQELIRDPLFDVDLHHLDCGSKTLPSGCMTVLGVTEGSLSVQTNATTLSLVAGDFCLVPASVTDATVSPAKGKCSFLHVRCGH